MRVQSGTSINAAQARREEELRQLALDGMPLRMLGKSGHWIIGSLHLYTAAGRWFDESSGRRGRLNDYPIRSLLKRECGPSSSPVEVGRRLCLEGHQRTPAKPTLDHSGKLLAAKQVNA